jgi:PAS domain S-box-containing protein
MAEKKTIQGIVPTGPDSDRSELERALGENKKFLQAIIETEPECVKLVASDGTLIMMNRAGLDMIQVSSLDQARGKSIYPLILPEYRESFVKLTEGVFQGKPGTLTFEMRGVRGRRRWLETHAVPLRNDQDEIVALLGITRDVTERKQTEESLKKERDFTAAVLNTVGSIVVVLDRDGKIVRFNRACEEASGYRFEEVQGRHVWDFLIPQEQVEGVKKVFENLNAGMFPNKYDNYWLAKNGQRRLIAWANTVILTADGSVEYIIATGIDVTEHRRAEEALLEEKRFSDAVIDNLPGTFYICDKQGSLIRWNKNVQEVTGYTGNELSGMNMSGLFLEDRELMAAKMKEVYDTGKASAEARILTKSGAHVPFLLTGFRLIIHDQQYLVCVGVDVSERKRLEDQLRQAQKMESIGTLAGGIAHDFNNILTAVIGYGNLLQKRIDEQDPLRFYVEQIIGAANRAAGLTRGLLAYGRQQILNPQPVDLNEIIRNMERLLARLIGEDVEFRSVLAEKEITVLADTGQIEQVLMNLVTNARDAMPGGGSLFLETETVELGEDEAKARGLRRPGTYALLTVTDTGSGMEADTRERIFEPFFTTKEVGKGTGLGLAIVYGTIKQHNGSVEVESEPGRGAAFKIYLPVVPEETDASRSVVLSPLEGGTETILVAEDDETVRNLTASVLTQFGYSVIQAEDGEAAVKKFSENRDKVRMLLLDVIMPKKNGREVFDKIRIFKPDVKALFLSGYTADIINQKGLLDKEFNFILKPVAINDLLRKVRAILDGK